MPSEWICGAEDRLEELRRTLLPREVKEYRLDKLEAIARRIDGFAPSDPVCLGYRGKIDNMLAELAGAPLPHARNKAYICGVGEMIGHLKKEHRLASKGEYTGMGMVAGLLLGTIAGLIAGSPPLAAAIGLTLGLATGLALDTRAKRAGRVI